MKLLTGFLISIFVFCSISYAGIIKDAAKGAAVYGIVKAGSAAVKHYSGNKFFKTKKQFKEYDVYQRDVEPDLKIQREHPRTGEIVEETNIERMEKGKPPYVDKDGVLEPVELHHSRQQGGGPLFEVSKSTHSNTVDEAGAKALHPYGREKNPHDPVDRKVFDKDRVEYWKDRAKDFYMQAKKDGEE